MTCCTPATFFTTPRFLDHARDAMVKLRLLRTCYLNNLNIALFLLKSHANEEMITDIAFLMACFKLDLLVALTDVCLR